jgi:predicted DNA-binding protein
MSKPRAVYNPTRPVHLHLSLNLIMKYDMLADALGQTRTAVIRNTLERHIDRMLEVEVPAAIAERHKHALALKV